jgi:hypothetical protein
MSCNRPRGNRSAVDDRRSNCTLAIAGEEDEVLTAGTQDALSVHGHQDTSQIRAWLRENLKDEAPAGP